MRHHAVQVPATSANLGAGFDAFGIALDRYLTVRSLPRSAQAERVAITGMGADELPSGDDNLIWRAVVRFCEHHDLAVPDIAVRARTTIPLERGLGSSSSAIVAGLSLARAVTEVEVGDPQVVELAAAVEGHADNVAPAVLGGLVACTTGGDGGLIIRRINPTPRLRPVVLVPVARQSTRSARAVLPAALPREQVAVQAGRAGHVLAALAGAWPAAAGAAGDLLHEPARAEVMAPSAALLQALREQGHHAWLSGAGPAVAAALALGDGAALDGVERVASDLGFELAALRFDLAGALACPDDGCGLAGAGGCPQCPRQRVD